MFRLFGLSSDFAEDIEVLANTNAISNTFRDKIH